MRLYNSFLIRCWLTQDPPQAERATFDVEHIQTGERMRAADSNEVCRWMLAVCHYRKAAPHRGAQGEDDGPVPSIVSAKERNNEYSSN